MDLSPDAWAAVAVGITSIASTVTAITVAHFKTSRQATAIANHVESVRKLAEPTGNGYADKTLTLLRGIGEQVAELRTDFRDLREEVKDDRSVVVQHLGEHAAGNRPRKQRWR